MIAAISKPSRKFCGQVFQTVHREIDAVFRQRFLNFLGEHALGADLGKGDIGDLVAGGLDDFNFDVVPALLEQRLDVVGLPERSCDPREPMRSRATNFPLRSLRRGLRRFLSSFSSSLQSPCLSCRLNSRRTMSTTVVASGSRTAVFSVLMGVCMILLMMPRVRASTASSCSGESGPRRPRTRSISAWRMVSRWSCSETMVGTTSSVCSRA